MKVQEHIDKISWSLADKGLMIIYGLVSIFQVKLINNAEEFALYFLLWQLYNWIFVLSDSLALQSIIQFGAIKEARPKVNLIALVMHIIIGLGIPLLLVIFRSNFADLFNEPLLAKMALSLPLLGLFTLPRNYVIKILMRDHRFRDIFIVNFFYFGTMSALTFYYYFQEFVFDYDLMINILMSGVILSTISGILISFKELKFSFSGEFTFRKMFKFTLPYFYYSVLHSVPKLLDSYILKAIGFRTETIGIYGAVKLLYRIFDEGASATYGLIYPVAVKLTAQNRIEELKQLMTKFVSFMLLLIVPTVILLNLGLTEFIVSFFDNAKYMAAVDMFNLMTWAAVSIPFVLLPLVITASGKPTIVLKYVSISVVVSLIGFIIAKFTGIDNLIPLGIIAYNYSLGILSFIYIKKHYGFPIKMIGRAFADTMGFIKSKFKNEN